MMFIASIISSKKVAFGETGRFVDDKQDEKSWRLYLKFVSKIQTESSTQYLNVSHCKDSFAFASYIRHTYISEKIILLLDKKKFVLRGQPVVSLVWLVHLVTHLIYLRKTRICERLYYVEEFVCFFINPVNIFVLHKLCNYAYAITHTLVAHTHSDKASIKDKPKRLNRMIKNNDAWSMQNLPLNEMFLLAIFNMLRKCISQKVTALEILRQVRNRFWQQAITHVHPFNFCFLHELINKITFALAILAFYDGINSLFFLFLCPISLIQIIESFDTAHRKICFSLSSLLLRDSHPSTSKWCHALFFLIFLLSLSNSFMTTN